MLNSTLSINFGSITMKKSDVDEILVQLYLRLNGYFTSGFIVHSDDWGRARTEVDCIAVRHTHSREPERQIEPSEFLGANEGKIDLILCEVKHDPERIQFNQTWKNDDFALASILRWSGLFPEEKLNSLASDLRPLLLDGVDANSSMKGVVANEVRIRALMCCPMANVENTDRWCLSGSEIIGYFHKCFNPEERRDSCSTRYNFQQWGCTFAPIVRYIKDSDRMISPEQSIQELYGIFDVA